MNQLLSKYHVSNFSTLMSAYTKAGIPFYNAIDGGAGSGSTSKEMLKFLEDDGVVFAFEPFPGNHRFFENKSERIKLIKKAMDCKNCNRIFYVHSAVSEGDEWAKSKNMIGYSSVGRLVDDSFESKENCYNVECCAADDLVEPTTKISFVKLDLQGGELDALKGMQRVIKDSLFLWVEYSGQAGLLELIDQNDYIVFDTQYFFLGSPERDIHEFFDITKENHVLSTNKKAWFGFKKSPWGKNYYEEFIFLKRNYGLVQTDLACINSRFLKEFINACKFLDFSNKAFQHKQFSNNEISFNKSNSLFTAMDPYDFLFNKELCVVCNSPYILPARKLKSKKKPNTDYLLKYCMECSSFYSTPL